jgi:prolyl oligopeptidase
MEKSIFSCVILYLITCSVYGQWIYPKAKSVDTSNTYWGVTVHDPYRWLENLNDSSVINWFKAEGEYTNSVMSNVPGQQHIISELRQLDKVESIKYSGFMMSGKGYVVQKRLPGEPIDKFYYRDGINGNDILLFDPSAYEKGKVFDANFDVSQDGRFILFNLSEQGKEIGFMRIMEVRTRKWLPDNIKNMRRGRYVAGTNNEIVYIKLTSSDVHDKASHLNNKLMLHIIGTQQTADNEILSTQKTPELNFSPSDLPYILTFDSCPFMFAGKGNASSNIELFYAPTRELTAKTIHWKIFCKYADEIQDIQGHNSDIYCLTTKGNHHYRLLKLPLPQGSIGSAEDIYAVDKDWKITLCRAAKDYLLINLSKNDVTTKAIVYNCLNGKTNEIHSPLNGITTITPYSSSANQCVAYTTGWNVPTNLYEFDPVSGKFSNGPFHTEFNYPGLNDLTVEEVEVPSYDGTLVPLSILYNKKYLKKDGTNICLLDGYGAYGYSFSPYFDYSLLPLLNRGSIYAVAHVRGGGEKGEDWHLSGFKTTKPNTWKDLNACAEWLIQNGYTTNQRLGCKSGSAGGILVGRAITERPDLYKVAIPKVAVLNAIRLEETPNGPGNIQEFGTMKDSVEAKALIEMDALYHVRPGVQYPAQLITTGINDPRVDSWIPGKFAAVMQAANNPLTPTLLCVNFKGGHFGGSTIDEQFAQTALEYAFLLWQCGDKEFQPKKINEIIRL